MGRGLGSTNARGASKIPVAKAQVISSDRQECPRVCDVGFQEQLDGGRNSRRLVANPRRVVHVWRTTALLLVLLGVGLGSLHRKTVAADVV